MDGGSDGVGEGLGDSDGVALGERVGVIDGAALGLRVGVTEGPELGLGLALGEVQTPRTCSGENALG